MVEARHLSDLNDEEGQMLSGKIVGTLGTLIDLVSKDFNLCDGCTIRLMIRALEVRYEQLREEALASKH